MNDSGIRPGDILFYACGNSFEDRLIQRFTYGPYVHCAIAISTDSIIESIGTHGVVQSPMRTPHRIIGISNLYTDKQIQRALKFLQRQIGSHYGFLDIIGDSIKAIFPKSISGTPFLISESSFSCSTLAVLFLIYMNYQFLPDNFYLTPHFISPNELFRVMSKI